MLERIRCFGVACLWWAFVVVLVPYIIVRELIGKPIKLELDCDEPADKPAADSQCPETYYFTPPVPLSMLTAKRVRGRLVEPAECRPPTDCVCEANDGPLLCPKLGRQMTPHDIRVCRGWAGFTAAEGLAARAKLLASPPKCRTGCCPRRS